jgi:hypothetical protein
VLVILALVAIGASAWVTASTGMFRQILGYYQPRDIPVLELAAAMRQEIPSAWSDTKVTRFWYDDDPARPGGSERRMIGSFWLHAFGRLTGEKESFIPLPAMTDGNAKVILHSGVERLVIFDQDTKIVDQALKQIQENWLPFALSKRMTLQSGSDPSRLLDVAILERPELAKRTDFTPIDLLGIHCGGHEKLQLIGQKARLTMTSNKWWNQARLSLPALKKGDRLRVRARIESGFVRFILGEDALQLEEHTDRWPSSSVQEVVFTASTDLPNPHLGLRSMYPNHSQSRLVLEMVGIEK